jgi:hypothetical protein
VVQAERSTRGRVIAGTAGNIEPMPERGDQNSDTGLVPVFGTWRNIYTAVIFVIVLMIAFVFLFSRFPY